MAHFTPLLNAALCSTGAITIVFLILAAATELDYLEIGVLALAAGFMIGLFASLGVSDGR